MAVYQNQDARGPRRPAAQPMGSQPAGPQVMSAGGKAVSFDHVLQKLQVSPLQHTFTDVQAELQRSRDESADLSGLSTQMNEIQDTLAGGMASPVLRTPKVVLIPGAIAKRQCCRIHPPSIPLNICRGESCHQRTPWTASSRIRYAPEPIDRNANITRNPPRQNPRSRRSSAWPRSDKTRSISG